MKTAYTKYVLKFEYQSILFQILRHADIYGWVLKRIQYSKKSIYLKLRRGNDEKLKIRISDHRSVLGFPECGVNTYWVNPYSEFERYILLMNKIISKNMLTETNGVVTTPIVS